MGHGGAGESKKTIENVVAFLAVLSLPMGTPTKAARAIGIDRRTAYNWRNEDDEFRAAWDSAVAEGTDGIEEEATRRAVEGVERPVFQGGECVGHIQEYSDGLMTTILKGRRPEVYRDKVEHSGSVEVQHSVEVTFVKGTKK